LPDGSIILVREIKKALDGEEFGYIPSGEKRMTKVPAVDMETFTYYHMVHRYNQKFGLPHGQGWINELPWVPQLLSYFDDLKNMIEAWQIKNSSGNSGDSELSAGKLT
jgi:hypothetical protein